jgi:hypothetical protein
VPPCSHCLLVSKASAPPGLYVLWRSRIIPETRGLPQAVFFPHFPGRQSVPVVEVARLRPQHHAFDWPVRGTSILSTPCSGAPAPEHTARRLLPPLCNPDPKSRKAGALQAVRSRAGAPERGMAELLKSLANPCNSAMSPFEDVPTFVFSAQTGHLMHRKCVQVPEPDSAEPLTKVAADISREQAAIGL